MATLGEQIRAARKLAGLNQRQLAEMVGVTPHAIHCWESGKSEPKGAIRGKLFTTLYATTPQKLAEQEEIVALLYNCIRKGMSFTYSAVTQKITVHIGKLEITNAV